MELKIAICDDDPVQRDYLFETVSSWAKEKRHLVKLCRYVDARSFLFAYSEEKDFDILLLDIEMPGMNGIALAKAVRRDSLAVQIVFVTGYNDYFSDGFDVSALHYLLKPVDEAKLCSVLDRAAANLAYRERSVLVSAPEGSVKVSQADILYLEAENVYVIVHTVHGNYRMRTGLAKFAAQLDESFLKVHRSFVVGLKYVKRITRAEITMANGDVLPVSRGMYDAIHAALLKYL